MQGPMARQVERRARRFQDMIEALDVDVIALIRLDGGDAYAEARNKCLHCVCPGDCLAWLSADDEKFEAPWYCANRDVFEICRRKR
jgi:Family of unknown function (DUF6455)